MSKRLETLRSQHEALVARQAAIKAELREIVERDGDPTDDEAVQTRSLVAEHEDIGPKADALRQEIESLEAVLNAPERAQVAGVAPTILVRKDNPLTDEAVMYGPVEQVRGAARTAIEKMVEADDKTRQALTVVLQRADDQTGRLSRHMIAASREEYRTAFAKLLKGDTFSLSPEEVRAVQHVRAAGLTDSLGGYAVPTVTDVSLIIGGDHDGLTPNTIRQLANVRPISGDNLNVTTTDGITASYVAAQTESTDGSPTLGRITITPHKAHTFVPFDVEIQGDWSAMESEMRRLMMIAKDDLEMTKFVTGTGSNEPLGLFYDIYTNYTARVKASAGSNTFAATDIYATAQHVPDRFRYRGVWLANEVSYDTVRTFATHAGGNMFQESIALDRPGTILGRPAYGQASIDSTYGSGENYILLFGDVREAYTIVDRVGMTVELIPHLFGGTNNYPMGMRGLYAWWRNGAAVVNDDAVAVLNIT